MRKALAFYFVFISVLFIPQMSSNPFSESENAETAHVERSGQHMNGGEYDEDPEIPAGDPNPGDPVPIDDYLPLLAVAAVGIIIYKTHQKKNLLS